MLQMNQRTRDTAQLINCIKLAIINESKTLNELMALATRIDGHMRDRKKSRIDNTVVRPKTPVIATRSVWPKERVQKGKPADHHTNPKNPRSTLPATKIS
ncbi:hypothetical protein ILYODFUR_026560 [Ilyodon furcidens]|uniref:Uncharacterized protein n=1 Tax=Ilyodon furcidens TaxID=33524 RepID=A0ABV0SPE9_9TELE